MRLVVAVYLSQAWRKLAPRRLPVESVEAVVRAEILRALIACCSRTLGAEGQVVCVARHHPERYGLDYGNISPWELWDRYDAELTLPAELELSETDIIHALVSEMPEQTHVRVVE